MIPHKSGINLKHRITNSSDYNTLIPICKVFFYVNFILFTIVKIIKLLDFVKYITYYINCIIFTTVEV